MERIRNPPLMNFPDTGGVADKYGVSRISGAKGTPHPNIEETFRKSGYIKNTRRIVAWKRNSIILNCD